MLNFGAKKKKKQKKNVKSAGKNCLQLNFQPGYCEDVNSVVRQTEKQVEITGETEVWRISQKSQVWNLNNTTGYPWEKKIPKMFRSSPIYGSNALKTSLQSDPKCNLQSGTKLSVLKAL